MLTNNKSAVISNKNQNELAGDTKAVDVKVERSDDEVQQSEIGSYTYNVTKEEMAARHDILQNVDRSNCSKETHSESRAETSEQSQNQNEPIIKLETEAMSTVREEMIKELYADHDIKDEMVIGPVVVQVFPCMMQEAGESLPKKPRLDTQDKNTESDNTAKGTRTETNTEEMTPNKCSENTEPSDTKPIEIVTNKIPTKISKPRNNTQRNIRNDKSKKRTRSIFQCNVKQYDKKPDLAQHIESHDKTKRDICLKCKECTYQSVTQCSLERHLQLHDKSRRFVCDVCGYRFMANAHLQQHLRNVHSYQKTHECGNCDYKTNNIRYLDKHLRIHTGEKPYSCSQCEFKSSRKGGLKLHLRIHTGEKPYSCSQCEFKSSQKSGLNMHSRIHTGDKPYSCSECNYKCAQSYSLKKHLRTHSEPLPKKPRLDTQDKTTEPDNTAKGTRTETNNEEITPKDCNENTEPSDTKPMENVTNKIPTKTSKPHNNTQKIRNDKNNKNVFQCNVCAKQYENKAELAQHIECHDKTKRDIYFKCKECTYQSVTQCSERHLKLHDKSRRFVCDVCGYRYMDNKQLQQHLRNVHSDEKKHECGICEFKTNKIRNLNEHLRKHSGEKPYSCSRCEFKCCYRSSLIRHLRIHTGEKPYSCSECNYKCSDKSNLKVHLIRHSK